MDAPSNLYRSLTSYQAPPPNPTTHHGTTRRNSTDSPAPPRPTSRSQPATGTFGPQDGETWTDFLRDTAGAAYITQGLDGPAPTRRHARGEGRSERPDAHRADSSSSAGHKRNSSARHGEVNKRTAPAPRSGPSGSSSDPIDLTTPERPSHSAGHALLRRQSSIILPPWQPDEEVTNCPVCRIGFTWYTRKHHCRKCGKVVCANCSQHRITIPRQFIVHPPVSVATDASPGCAGLDDATPSNLGGGEVVRVCNPCVPDPNYSPPPPPPGYGENAFTMRLAQASRRRQPQIPERTTSVGSSGFDPPPYQAGGGQATAPPTRHDFRFASQATADQRSARAHAPAARHDENRSSLSRRATVSSLDRHNSNVEAGASQHRAREASSRGLPDPLGIPPFSARTEQLARAASEASNVFIHRRNTILASQPRPAVQRRQSGEFCPICNKTLEELGVDWKDDDAKAGHVDVCIQNLSSSFSGPARHSAADRRVGSESTQEGRGAGSGPGTASGQHGLGGRILSYRATEKDCVQSDGSVAECIICMEDFDVGQELGRLDCFCRFHAHCILEWWQARRAANQTSGECPTHKVNRGG